ncbi:Histidine acid phosphatase [Cordyceps militaris CM01]|uniref:Histidine acid phosphatase n=1 Tax=Cordyceps militaris (strain CM01) TaxID=983644 RepID=G3J8Z0_CORMM|nr:Histidine acid phosphatase [Cordyceps militaris CM01]EGX94022.1 Histidine acid phosphatase [Cordyceps militaris CM01]
MHSKLLLLSALAAAGPAAAETVLGVYVFHRHGDRTSKSYPPTSLTALGADQVHDSGAFYRARYVAQNGSVKIAALSDGAVVLSQLSVTSPKDGVLHNSAVTFLQGLYPPRGDAGNETLADGRSVQAPLGGYQFIPVDAISDAATIEKAESNAWLQGNTGCTNAEVSSKSYFSSDEFTKTSADSKDFYQSLLPVINSTFASTEATFKNAYTIFDYVNVASIHNKTIPSGDLVKPAMPRLLTLASDHEWNLAYNKSEAVRAIAGSVLAGQILGALDALAKGTKGSPTFNAQFGAYGTLMAFFGLARLPAASADFYGICNYASSMTFELVTNATAGSDGKYKPEDLSVRFFFANGTATSDSFKQWPLFAQTETTLSWPTFKDRMNEFAIQDNAHWCSICGSTSGKCAANSTSPDGGSASTNSSGGVSRPVAGVIGALVALAVILGVQAAVMLFGGFRLMKKSSLRPQANTEAGIKA